MLVNRTGLRFEEEKRRPNARKNTYKKAHLCEANHDEVRRLVGFNQAEYGVKPSLRFQLLLQLEQRSGSVCHRISHTERSKSSTELSLNHIPRAVFGRDHEKGARETTTGLAVSKTRSDSVEGAIPVHRYDSSRLPRQATDPAS